MNKIEKRLIRVLHGEKTDRMPIWLMRQAGRYLPEYRELRAKAGGFLDLCLTPAWAGEITLQPIRRFGFDAAILFADILLIPYALGLKLEFREGEGPVLQKIEDEKDILRLKYDDHKLSPVYETIGLVKEKLPKETALIGFCGAPWTVACYMIDGNSKSNFSLTKKWVKEQPDKLDQLIAVLIDASESYLVRQIEAGAEVLQIFDSWAGLLKTADFMRFVIKPTQDLVKRLKKKYPHIPLIGFPREAGDFYRDYIRMTGVDALSIDQHVPIDYAKQELQNIKPLQGNLDPILLVKGGPVMRDAIDSILSTFGSQHIFNLGHGIVPETPLDHVAELVKIVHTSKLAS